MAGSLTIFGEKLYQARARRALPVLVRQAHAERPLTYGALATELRIPNPRTLNYPLGAIGHELRRLGKRWRLKIPPLQMLVHNAASRVPGHGFYGFIGEKGGKLSLRQKRLLTRRWLDQIYAFPRWDEVLSTFGLRPAPMTLPPAALLNIRVPRGGESREHRTLKRFVAERPGRVGITGVHEVIVEYRLPSGDSIDVLFKTKQLHLAVEVKADNVGDLEIARGLFQCTKYQAVLAAMNGYASVAVESESVLVLGGRFPPQLVDLRNALGIRIVERVRLSQAPNALHPTAATGAIRSGRV